MQSTNYVLLHTWLILEAGILGSPCAPPSDTQFGEGLMGLTQLFRGCCSCLRGFGLENFSCVLPKEFTSP